MKTKPLIGITAEEIDRIKSEWRTDKVHGQNGDYVDAVVRAGGSPIILPITSDAQVWQEYYELCDGFLFSGGNDIDPKYYGQEKHPETEDISAIRDVQEFALIDMVLKGDKPLLAICRGMQLLNIHQGGTLFQHIQDDVEGAGNHDVSKANSDVGRPVHVLKIAAGSRLESILGTNSVAVNSRHHQSVHELGNGLTATAWAEDGVVEAVEFPRNRFVMGVQGHPESMESATEVAWRKLFKAFVDSSKVQDKNGRSSLTERFRRRLARRPNLEVV